MPRALTLGFGAGPKKAAPVTSLAVALGTVAGNLNVTWVNPDPLTYDGWILYSSVDAGANYTQVATRGDAGRSKASTVAVIFIGYSTLAQFKMVTTKSFGDNSIDVVSSALRTVPGIPTIISLVASNPGTATLNASAAPGSNIAGYDVQLSTNGGSTFGATVDTGTNPDHVFTGIAHNSSTVVRVRTRDTFSQLSDWRTSSAVTVPNDTVGPVVPTPTVVWNSTGFDVSWTAITDAAGSSVDTVILQISVGGSAFSTVNSYTNGNARTVFDGTASGDRGKSIRYRLYCADVYNNYTTGAASTAANSKPLGTFYILPITSASYSVTNAAWRSDTDDLASGTLDGTYGLQNGGWFYGTRVADTCLGFAPDTARLLFARAGASGSSGTNAFRGHTNASKPAGAMTLVGTTDTGPTLTGADAVADHVLSAAWKTLLGNGGLTGFATVDSGGYRRLYGISSNGYSGMITVIYT